MKDAEPIQSRKQYPSNDRNGEPIFEGDFVKGVGKHVGQSEVFFDAGQWQPFSYLNDFDGNNYELVKRSHEPIQSVNLDDADFDKMCDEFGFLELIKIACQTNGIGNNYFKKKKELKEKYWQAKQQQIVPEISFKCDNISEIINLERDDAAYAHYLNLMVVDKIRCSYGTYIWACPIKFENKIIYAWEIEYENGETKSYGYCGEVPEINSYEEAIELALRYYNHITI